MKTKYELQSELKSTTNAYLFFFFLFGTHFAYLNKWGLQILFWITGYGLGFWALYEMFTLGNRVKRHNATIYEQLEKLAKAEKDEDLAKQLAMIKAIKD